MNFLYITTHNFSRATIHPALPLRSGSAIARKKGLPGIPTPHLFPRPLQNPPHPSALFSKRPSHTSLLSPITLTTPQPLHGNPCHALHHPALPSPTHLQKSSPRRKTHMTRNACTTTTRPSPTISLCVRMIDGEPGVGLKQLTM